ncbi:hypothetical protein CBR_g5581 [Chara braunii]|uniref:Tf2-1-like SH3-like domain-containing protein n=1 Tax=Chara braunii TaxID=69332 RepID=A0A388JRH1_CHABU|nr:hypothetical protein CBR_g5581 [Chara braunii]|eukprot:GBG60404.1 hypothetical protein CBR_g5581 [Chara braunii]
MDDYPIQGLLALSVLLGPLFQLMFPLGFGRVCTSRMLMRSGTVKPGPTPAEQAEIDRRLADKKKEKEAKKKQKEEEARKKMKEKMERELEEELKSIEESEVEEQEEEQTLQRRRQDIPESSTTTRLHVEPLDWGSRYYYSSEPLKETDEERDTFITKLATVTDAVERNLMLEEKRSKLNRRLLAARRQEVEEKKKLHAKGEKLQKALEAQKESPSETEAQLALLRETVLNTRQDMKLMHQTLQRVEAHRVEFENVWNNFVEKSAKDVDQHVQTNIQALDEHINKVFTPEVVEKIVKGAGGNGGDGDGDDDDDKKGKRKVGDPKEKLPQETGQVNKIKIKLPWTYNGTKEESVLHWAAAIETYVYGQRIPCWDRVLMATSCMGGDAMSFAILLQKEAGCNSMVEYSQQTRIEDFLKAARMTPKLTRWAAEIDMFDFELKPVKEFAPEKNISQKLLPTYRGPWQVLDVIGDVDGPSYVIEIPPHLRTYPVFHASKLYLV